MEVVPLGSCRTVSVANGVDEEEFESSSEQESSSDEARGARNREEPSFLSGSKAVVFGSKINVLLPFGIMSFVANVFKWGDPWVFGFSILALIPCAERISFVTEEVAKSTNDTIGGLVNATFGNITELVVSLFALKAGMLRVVQLSLLGSILSNLLLVLGTALSVGGFFHKQQQFAQAGVLTSCSVLVVSCLALSMPTVLDLTHSGTGHGSGWTNWNEATGDLDDESSGGDSPAWLSRIISCVMLFVYGSLMLFQMKTHTYLFNGDDDDEEDGKVLSFCGGLIWLAIITAGVTYLSDLLVDTVVATAKRTHVPILFLSGIVIPIVGNATEHAAAVTFAARNKMEIALASSIGSAVQIALFAIPVTVLAGWTMGVEMSLNFQGFEMCCLLVSSLLTTFVLMEGRSFWITGVMLVLSYFIIAAGFWCHSDRTTMA